MNKIFKTWLPTLVASVALVFSACTDSYDYTPEPDADYAGAYILADQTSIILTQEDTQELSFTVCRHDSTEAASYKLENSNPEELQVPTEVSFAANEARKTITVPINVPLGTVNSSVTVSVVAEDAYEYGAHSQTFSISRLKKVDGCQLLALGGLFEGAALWGVDVYEYGKTGDGEGNISATYYVKDPYSSEDVGLPADCYGRGNYFSFTLTSDGNAALASGSSLFYCSASFTGNPAVTGDLSIQGDGTYYSQPTELVTGSYFSNFILFNWSSSIGDTQKGYGTLTHAVIFPEGYNPLTQSQAE